MDIKVEDLKKVKLNKGDVVIVTYDNDTTTDDTLKYMLELMEETFPDNKIIFKTKDIAIDVVEGEDD